MKLVRDLSQLDASWRGGAVAIGNFDGVHLGHARIVSRLREHAQRVAGPSVIFTFDPHPAQLLRPDRVPPPLTWTERKADLLAQLGVDLVIAYPTDWQLLALEPIDFFRQVIQEALGAQALVEGPNFYFGKDRAGDVELLSRYCRETGISLEIVAPLEDSGETISSSRIRQHLSRGQLDDASRLLTRAYRIRGEVVAGAARGRQLGFPTANLASVDTLIPAPGVYAGWAYPSGQPWPAAIHIGPNPTFAEAQSKVEVHLIDFSGSLYGQTLEVDFLARLRDIHTFPDVDSLLRQLHQDVQNASGVCATASASPPPALST